MGLALDLEHGCIACKYGGGVVGLGAPAAAAAEEAARAAAEAAEWAKKLRLAFGLAEGATATQRRGEARNGKQAW